MLAEQIEPILGIVKPPPSEKKEYHPWPTVQGVFRGMRRVHLQQFRDEVLAIGYYRQQTIVLLAMMVGHMCWATANWRELLDGSAAATRLRKALLKACADSHPPIVVREMPADSWPPPHSRWLDLPSAIAKHYRCYGRFPLICYPARPGSADELDCLELSDIEDELRRRLGVWHTTSRSRGQLTRFFNKAHATGGPQWH